MAGSQGGVHLGLHVFSGGGIYSEEGGDHRVLDL